MVSEHLWPEYQQPVSCSFICRYERSDDP